MQKMFAELLFDTTEARDRAIPELTRRGFEIEILDWVDEYEGVILSPTVWINVRGGYVGSDHEFFAEMMHVSHAAQRRCA
jgi:hypothetical protein